MKYGNGPVLAAALLLFSASNVFSRAANPLCEAAQEGDVRQVASLLDEGADPNMKCGGKMDVSPIAFAISECHVEVVKLLWEKGAVLELRSENERDDKIWKYLSRRAVKAGCLSSDGETLGAAQNCDMAPRPAGCPAPGETAQPVEPISISELRAGKAHAGQARARAQCGLSDAIEQGRAADEAAFTQAMRTGPRDSELPEDAHRFEVKARWSVKKEDFKGAAQYYAQAIQAAPLWPEGRYNYALVLAKDSCYEEAILQMKRYLKLAPSAPDARKAKDRMYEWEAEMEKGGK